MAFLIGVVVFVLALLVSVMLHEAGHFLTAKKFGMKVTQFFVGFGNTLWSVKRGETEYGIKSLPLGGFVKITGMTMLDQVDPADEPRSFRKQPGWQRSIVLAAGSFMHFVLALVLLFLLAVGIGVTNTPTIGAVSRCVPVSPKAVDSGSCQGSHTTSPAKLAGFRAGDIVLSVGGTRVRSWTQVGKAIRAHPVGKPLAVVVQRGGHRVTLTVTPGKVPHRKGSFLGIDEQIFKQVGPARAVAYGGSMFGQVLSGTAAELAKLPAALPDLFAKNRAKTPAGNVSSVVGAADFAGQAVSDGGGWRFTVSALVLIVIELNIVVGAFNLLPVLPMDGGHLAAVAFERIRAWLARLRGRPDPGLVNMNRLIPVSFGVFALLVGLSVLLIMADLVNPIHLQ